MIDAGHTVFHRIFQGRDIVLFRVEGGEHSIKRSGFS